MGRLDLITLAAAAAAAQTYTGAATVIHHASISNEVRCSSRCVKPAVNHTRTRGQLSVRYIDPARPTGLLRAQRFGNQGGRSQAIISG